MNVLLVTSRFPPEHSGSGKRLYLTYERLRRLMPGLRYRVLTQSRKENLTATVEGAEVTRIPSYNPGRRIFIKPLRFLMGTAEFLHEAFLAFRHLKRIEPDGIGLVHTAGSSWLVFISSWWAHRHTIPLVRELTSAADRPAESGFFAGLTRMTLRWSRLIVAISPMLSDSCQKMGFGGKVWCRPNPVDPTVFFPTDSAGRKRLRRSLFGGSVGDDKILLIYLGRICAWKNQGFLLDVLTGLPENFHLALIGPNDEGDKPYLNDLVEKARILGVTGRLHVVAENVSSAADYLRASDIFVFPSPAEGLGNAVLESLMCGLPVVANRLEGVTTWIVEEGRDGYLSPLDTESFKQAVLRAHALIPGAEHIATAARRRFSSDIIDVEYLNRLRAVAGRRSARLTRILNSRDLSC